MIDLEYITKFLCCTKNSDPPSPNHYKIPSNQNIYDISLDYEELADLNYNDNIYIKTIYYPSFKRYDTYIYTKENNDYNFYLYTKYYNSDCNLLLEYKLSNINSFYDLNLYFKLCYHNTKNKAFKSAYKLKLKEILDKKVNIL